MRKRNVQILFRLTEEEADELNELVRKSGRSKEAFLRAMVKGYRLCEKPAPEFYQIMRELSAIGNRVNQLAAKANALNFVDAPMLTEEAVDIVNIGLHFFLKNVRPYAASCSEA